MRLAGRDRPVWGEVIDDEQQVAAWLRRLVETTPAAARRFGITPEAARQPDLALLIQAARDRVLLRFRLADEEEHRAAAGHTATPRR